MRSRKPNPLNTIYSSRIGNQQGKVAGAAVVGGTEVSVYILPEVGDFAHTLSG